MSILSAVKAILEADTTLLATATGGIWDYDETGRMGLSRTITPAAFDSAKRIKPCVLLKTRERVPDGELVDDAAQLISYRQILEVWLYEDTGYAHMDTMADRIYALLHGKRLSGAFHAAWAGEYRSGQRDLDLDANLERSDYLIRATRSA
jgi:hypothetical protein